MALLRTLKPTIEHTTQPSSVVHYRTVVHLQVLAAIATIVAAYALAARMKPVEFPAVRGEALLGQAKWLAIPLVTAIFLVMLKRGRSAELIKGAAANRTAPGLQEALLGNTVEQTCLAVLSMAAFAAAAPQDLGLLLQVSVAIFCTGRALFFGGYAINPMWRFYGFSLNFYSSVILLALAWWFSARA